MEITTGLTEDEIWRRVYLLGGDDYTVLENVVYVLRDGKCIAEISLLVRINNAQTTAKL